MLCCGYTSEFVRLTTANKAQVLLRAESERSGTAAIDIITEYHHQMNNIHPFIHHTLCNLDSDDWD